MSQAADIEAKIYPAELDRKAGIPLYRQLEKRFCAMLQDGALTHGEQLPSEAEMMEQFGVSRTTVRLALKMCIRDRLYASCRFSSNAISSRC